MNFLTHVLLLISILIPCFQTTNILPSAVTEQGIYIGQQKTINHTNVNYWYGIPYAQQPIQNLRWMPPLSLPIENGTRYAFIPNACPQKNDLGVSFSESCLTLNIYAPANASNIPVYVWIHGGSFTTGAGIEYDAMSIVSVSIKHDVPIIVATINYRLGLLGFLADQGLYNERSGKNNQSTTGNYGILDQIMAIDWIKRNIVGFGGDPTQITIGGESAGGVSVTMLLTSSLIMNDTFQRAIIESGGLWPNAVTQLEIAMNMTGTILRNRTNCTNIECLRHLSVNDILEVQNRIASESIFGVAATPVIDGYVLNDTMENYYMKGYFQKLPILIGSTTNETSYFTCPIFNQSASVGEIETFLNRLYNTTIVEELSSIYGSISSYKNPLTYLNIIYSDSWAHCESRRIAAKFSAYGLPAYLYTYNHLIPMSSTCFGIAHAAELPMLFPALLPFLFPFYKFNAMEEQLSLNMMLYWINFIRTSNPNFMGSLTFWDAYQYNNDGDLVLDIELRMRNHYYDYPCSRLWDHYATIN